MDHWIWSTTRYIDDEREPDDVTLFAFYFLLCPTIILYLFVLEELSAIDTLHYRNYYTTNERIVYTVRLQIL